jgi:sigma-E factor negative regulatory protein RseB
MMRQGRWHRSMRAMAACAALWCAATVQAGSEDPRVWITRMNEALATRNYDGVFVHVVGGQREVLRIIHRIKDGKLSERLIATDGSGREFVRNGSEWVAYFPDRRIAVTETRNRSFGFIETLHRLTAESERYYALSSVGTRRVQGVQTQLIAVTPRDALRYGYRFWLDKATGMPVQTQLVAQSGEVIEEISFLSLTLPKSISDELFKPDVDSTGFRWMRRDVPPDAPKVKAAFVPRSELLPPGFAVRVVNMPGQQPSHGPRTRFIVSDGIAWVSVFVESADMAPRVGDHTTRRPDGVVQMGSSAAYVAQLNGYRVTVVGEVPPATVKSIAEAVRPE